MLCNVPEFVPLHLLCPNFQTGEGDREEEEDSSSKLTDEDKLSCAQVVQEYLAGRIADPVTAGSRHSDDVN